MALVDAVQSKQVGSRAGSGGGVLVMPHHHGDVVTKGNNSAASQIDGLGNDVLLGQKTSKFQV